MSIYDNLIKNDNIINEIYPRFVINFINGPYLEVSNSIGYNFDISFIDKKTGISHYNTNISNGCWTRSNISYFVDWKIIATRNDGEVFEFEFDPTDQKVFITLESKSLGDTLAWFPYIDEFQKKWNCKVVCSTFHNHLFIDQYPNLEFISPGSVVNGIYAMYKIGLFFDDDDINYRLHKKDPKKLPLLEIASDILGLEYSEVRPKLKLSNVEKRKRVGIGFHSTAQTKYWNNPTGWQELTDFLISKGYEVVVTSSENDGYMGNFYPTGAVKIPQGTIENLIDEINSCEFFIGISSGLSWLAWAINIPVVLISGFTGEYLEPTDNVIRVIEKSVCNDCWSRHRFNPGDWNWCPDHKETDRQFECTKSITGKMVIDKIIDNKLIDHVFNFDKREKLGELLINSGLLNKGVQVSASNGDFSKVILENWPGKLYMIDYWKSISNDDNYFKSINNINEFEDRAFMLRMDDLKSSELFENESLDFVYFDTNDIIKEQIDIWYKKIKSGGLLLGYDYIPESVVTDFLLNNNYDLYKTDDNPTTWYIIKR